MWSHGQLARERLEKNYLRLILARLRAWHYGPSRGAPPNQHWDSLRKTPWVKVLAQLFGCFQSCPVFVWETIELRSVSSIDHIRCQDKSKFLTVNSCMFLHELSITLPVLSSVWLVQHFLMIISNWAGDFLVEFAIDPSPCGMVSWAKHCWMIFAEIAMTTRAIPQTYCS